MGFWPFGASKKNRKRASTDQPSTTLLEKSDPTHMARHGGSTVQQGTPQSTRAGSRQQNEEKARKLSKPRPPSHRGSSYNLPHSYTSPTYGSPHAAASHSASYLNQNMSQSSIGPETFTAISPVPTLYARRQDYDPSIPRKKSSKRKAEDHARERELRAMSAPVPIPKPKRPATYSGSGPLQREMVNVPGDLRRPSSQVSLPIPENISETDSAVFHNSFKIGIFAALSPRPTIKYDGRSRSSLGKQPARLQPVHQSIEEEDLTSSRRRIDDLADNLDSTALRELMDRDQKRRQKKRETDRQKLQKKLQRRADKEQEESTRRARAEEFARSSSANLRDQQQSPIGPNADLDVPEALQDDPFSDPQPEKVASPVIRNPFEDEKDVDVMQDSSDREDEAPPPIPVQSPQRKAGTVHREDTTKPSQAAISPPSSPIQPSTGDGNMSQLSFQKEAVAPEAAAGLEAARRPSNQSAAPGGLWTSFFRRGSRRKDSGTDRGRLTPSEFSNTSRESFARKPPPQLNTSQRTFRRTDGAMPQRTMSKFREDLPELPLSPPDSRMQSPEAQPTQPINISSRHLAHSRSGPLDGRSLATSSSIPTLDRGRGDSRHHSMLSGDDGPGHALSQSLASVDSEGSWLSGKPVKRLSGPLGTRHIESVQNDEMAETLAEDPYLNRLSPEPAVRRQSGTSGRRPSSTLLDLKAEQGAAAGDSEASKAAGTGEMWHVGVARQPTVVKAATRAKSSEGLLKNFQSADMEEISSEEDEDEEKDSPRMEEAVQLMRARSVDYGKGHARQISAGSAKMLDIKRTSGHFATPPLTPAMRSANALAGQEASSKSPE